MQAGGALKQLVNMRQQSKETLVGHHEWHMSLVELMEQAHGRVTPVAIAEQNVKHGSDPSGIEDDEQSKLLAFIFMDGADKNVFGPLMKDLNNDHALGNDVCPKTMEDALQVLTRCVMKHGRSNEDSG